MSPLKLRPSCKKKIRFVQAQAHGSPILKHSTLQDVAAGAHIITDAAKGDLVFVVKEGRAQQSIGGRTETLNPGDMFGELHLLTKQAPPVSVTAVTDVTLFAIERKKLAVELRRSRVNDPPGFDSEVEKYLVSKGVIANPRSTDLDLAAARWQKMAKEFRAAPWHGIAGTYVLVSSVVAMALIPFSPASLPTWWVGSFALAAWWNAWSGLQPGRFKRYESFGINVKSSFYNGALIQQWLSYMVLRSSWNNMTLSVPGALEGPWIHVCDAAMVLSTVARGFRPEAVAINDWSVFVANIGAVITPIWWTLFFLKPGWIHATLTANVEYNLTLAFMIQAGAAAAALFLPTLEIRGLITTEQDNFWTAVIGILGANWQSFVALVNMWPVFFDLLTFKDWLAYPLFGM